MRVYLCEKPSQGKDIARVLGAGQRGKGYYSGAGVIVTWCIGHLVEAVPPEGYGEQYKRWAIEQLPILPQRWRVEPKAATAAQFKVVQQLVAKAGELVIATDADREGEMIAREIIELCSYRGPIQRLWLSALNDASIRKALGALKPSAETLPLYFSALARSRADWLIGMNLSRLFTLLGRQAGYNGVLSVGRVQTPTLKLVVDRDREIARFVSVPFWAIEVALSHAGQSFVASWTPPQGSTDDAGRCLQQGELVKAMKGVAKLVTDPRLKQKLKDTTGIGTEATRANIISGLLARGYLLKKGRAIRASDAAFTLIDAVPEAIADPGTTAVWEQALDMIEAGQMTLDTFIVKQSSWVTQLVQQYRGASLDLKLPPAPSCPQCGAPMRQRSGKSGAFWSCSRYPDCKATQPIEEAAASKRGASSPRRRRPKAS